MPFISSFTRDSSNEAAIPFGCLSVFVTWLNLITTSPSSQDAFATASQNKAEAAQTSNRFVDEIIPVIIPKRRAADIVFATDEFIRLGVTTEVLSKLKAAFKKMAQ